MQSMLEIALRNSQRLLSLINDLLDLQKIEAGRFDFEYSDFEMAPFIQNVLDANEGYAKPLGVTFVLGESQPGLWVHSDAARLSQVLSNLLSNAAKFSPSGAEVRVGLKRNGDLARVEVHDQGAGIPEAFQPHIFEKFAQADSSATRAKGGTGLGLSICKAMLDQLGGNIGFESIAPNGTTFFFEIPLLSEKSQPPRHENPGQPETETDSQS
jgi:signal transduction histidine kinase